MHAPDSKDGLKAANPSEKTTNKAYLKLILLILLVDLIGFSLVVPLLPLYADSAGFSARQIGFLQSAYPFCQLFAAPILGRLSDRLGRKPVLVASQIGTTIGFLILALTQRFELMLLARMLDGASGGNILVAQAYIADVTSPQERSKSLGLMGMVFGLGFIIGPALGGILAGITPADSAVRLPFLAAAMFSMTAWIIVLRKLPESRRPGEHGGEARVVGRAGLRAVLGDRRISLLVLATAFLTLGWSNFESTISLFLKHRMQFSASEASLVFAFSGIVGAFAQGFLIRKMITKYGERKLVVWGMATLCVGFIALSQVYSLWALFPALILAGLGQGMATPSLSGLISRSCSPSIQGSVFGTLNAAQTGSRMINYSVANMLRGQYGESAPFLSGAVMLMIGLLVVREGIKRLDASSGENTSAQRS